jgi:hypothetical protein
MIEQECCELWTRFIDDNDIVLAHLHYNNEPIETVVHEEFMTNLITVAHNWETT